MRGFRGTGAARWKLHFVHINAYCSFARRLPARAGRARAPGSFAFPPLRWSRASGHVTKTKLLCRRELPPRCSLFLLLFPSRDLGYTREAARRCVESGRGCCRTCARVA